MLEPGERVSVYSYHFDEIKLVLTGFKHFGIYDKDDYLRNDITELFLRPLENRCTITDVDRGTNGEPKPPINQSGGGKPVDPDSKGDPDPKGGHNKKKPESIFLDNPPMLLKTNEMYSISINYNAQNNRYIELWLYDKNSHPLAKDGQNVKKGKGSIVFKIKVLSQWVGSKNIWYVSLQNIEKNSIKASNYVKGVSIERTKYGREEKLPWSHLSEPKAIGYLEDVKEILNYGVITKDPKGNKLLERAQNILKERKDYGAKVFLKHFILFTNRLATKKNWKDFISRLSGPLTQSEIDDIIETAYRNGPFAVYLLLCISLDEIFEKSPEVLNRRTSNVNEYYRVIPGVLKEYVWRDKSLFQRFNNEFEEIFRYYLILSWVGAKIKYKGFFGPFFNKLKLHH